MEYYYRCQKCGRRTPSFDYEDYLKDYAIDWEVDNEKCICDVCKNKKNKDYIRKNRIFEMILFIFLFLTLLLCFYYI